MPHNGNRREFVAAGTMAVATAAVAGRSLATQKDVAAKHGLKKAVKIGMVRERLPLVDKLKLLKKLGFDGVELNSPNSLARKEVLAARDESGLPIHGVVDSIHWRQTLSHPDPRIRAQGVAGLTRAIEDSQAYGGTSVLLVPAVVNKTVGYADAYQRSQAEIRKAIPLAEKLGIKILLENVWNNFLLSPVETARYIDELNDGLKSPVVGAYFDVGNVVRYGWPEHWIAALGQRIGKLDIKEYSRKLQHSKGPAAGFRVKLGEGDCDWPAVMKALARIGFSGWATAELAGGDRNRLKDISKRMDRIFGG